EAEGEGVRRGASGLCPPSGEPEYDSSGRSFLCMNTYHFSYSLVVVVSSLSTYTTVCQLSNPQTIIAANNGITNEIKSQKSSWNIRGSPKATTNTAINRSDGIRRKGSDRFIHKILDNTAGGEHRVTSPGIAGDINSINSDLVNGSAQTSSQDNSNIHSNRNNETKGLRRMKGMSYSVTDLRQLSDKKDFDWLEVSDDFQQEIKDRRHEMYIAEIEMDSYHHLGSTLRIENVRQMNERGVIRKPLVCNTIVNKRCLKVWPIIWT
ncbi:unnamed protein product, partial [Medioppia subpectinata]